MRLKKAVMLILLSLFMFSSTACLLIPRVVINEWKQLPDGSLSVNFSVTNTSRHHWSGVEVGFKCVCANGFVIVYGSVADLAPKDTKDGKVSTSETKGLEITKVRVFTIDASE